MAVAGWAPLTREIPASAWLFVSGLATLGLLFLHAPDAFTDPRFWAEDGTVLWTHQAHYGWSALLMPYGGYPITAPRLIAFAASFFDPAIAPRLFAFGAITIAVWSAVTAATCVPNINAGAFLGPAMILTPMYNSEIFGFANAVQWVMAPTLALILVSPFDRNKLAFATLAALTGPTALLLGPLAAWQFYRRRGIVPLIVLACAALTAFCVFSYPGSFRGDGNIQLTADVKHLANVILSRSAGPNALSTILGSMVLLLAIIIPGEMRKHRIVLISFGVLVIFGTFAKFFGEPHALDGYAGSRYFFVPNLVLMWCAILLFAEGHMRALCVAFLAVMIASGTPIARTPLPEDYWAEQIRAGKKQIEINPSGWTVSVP